MAANEHTDHELVVAADGSIPASQLARLGVAPGAHLHVVDGEWDEPEMAPLPEGWGRMANGQPMPNVVAAVRRSREGH